MGSFAHARNVLALAGLALSVGCGFNVGDIDRTQPDKVKKALFTDGKPWYFRQTIIDLPATTDISFIGEQGSTHKVLWMVDQNFLYAYRAHEQLKGGESYAQRPGVPYRGSPVAAFPILDHFDIQRQFNPATGEQTNVIAENTTDRPWYEREYMRVDWTKNEISDFTFSGASVAQQSVGRYIREGENDKDAAKITPNYIDLVHEGVAEPDINWQYTRWFGFPILNCWLYNNIYIDCLGSRFRVRSSFMKASEDYVYTAQQYDDNKQLKFGYFRTDRYGYDRYYGIVDTKVDYLIERFNLWTVRPGEQPCWDTTGMSAHPWSSCGNDRLRPIVYHVNEDMPAYLAQGNVRIGQEWNRVYKDVVSAMTGRPTAELPDIFVMCPNNPVRQGDPAACGSAGLNPQLGDLRYNMVWYVRGPQQSSPLGYGPHAPDATTGEVLSANSFIYGAALETYTQYAVDFVKLLNGDLTVNDLYQGANIVQHYQRLAMNRDERTRASRMEPEDMRKIAGKMHIREKATELRQRLNRGELSQTEIPARINKIRGTELESLLTPEEVRKGLLPQFENATDVPAELRAMLSPATLNDPAFMRLSQEREFRLGSRSVDMTEFFEDGGMTGLARRLSCDENKASAEDIARFCRDGKLREMEAYNFLLEEIYVAVTLHEVGHNVGLRHNFAGTTDSINYGPKYWELRGLTRRNQTDKEIKPEFNLTSANEQAGLTRAINSGIREYQNSSIMDYGAKPNSDFLGLGLYDYAAVLYGYGDMVEVFDTNAVEDPPGLTRTQTELLVPGVRHYTTYPDIIASAPGYSYEQRVNAMYRRKAVPEASVKANTDLVEVPYRFCSDEYVKGLYYCYRFDEGADAYEQVSNNVAMYENYYVFNGMRRNRVGFGTNLMGYIGRIYGRYFDFQADQAKHFLNDNLIARFWDPGCTESIHFVDPKCGLDRFWAATEAANALGRVIQTAEPGCYVRRNAGCYLDSNEDVNGLPANITKMPDSFCDNPGANPGGTVTRVRASDPYTHIEDSLDCSAWTPLLSAGANDVWLPAFEVGLGDGRYALDKYDRARYGYDFYWKPVVIGSWWDKWLAMQALGDPYTEFLGVDARGDSRSYLISFNSLFRNDIATTVGSFITEDAKNYGPYIIEVNGAPQLRYRDLVAPASSGLSQLPGFTRELPPGATPLNPDDQYMTRLQAMFIGSAFYTQITDDQDFNEGMMIGKAGSDLDIQVSEAVKNSDRYVEITDPVSGAIYFAVKARPDQSWFLDERSFYSSGYEYVKRVRDEFYTDATGTTLKPGVNVGSVRSEIRMFEIMRAYVHTFNFTYASGILY
jgi:hypothetical protein